MPNYVQLNQGLRDVGTSVGGILDYRTKQRQLDIGEAQGNRQLDISQQNANTSAANSAEVMHVRRGMELVNVMNSAQQSIAADKRGITFTDYGRENPAVLDQMTRTSSDPDLLNSQAVALGGEGAKYSATRIDPVTGNLQLFYKKADGTEAPFDEGIPAEVALKQIAAMAATAGARDQLEAARMLAPDNAQNIQDLGAEATAFDEEMFRRTGMGAEDLMQQLLAGDPVGAMAAWRMQGVPGAGSTAVAAAPAGMRGATVTAAPANNAAPITRSPIGAAPAAGLRAAPGDNASFIQNTMRGNNIGGGGQPVATPMTDTPLGVNQANQISGEVDALQARANELTALISTHVGEEQIWVEGKVQSKADVQAELADIESQLTTMQGQQSETFNGPTNISRSAQAGAGLRESLNKQSIGLSYAVEDVAEAVKKQYGMNVRNAKTAWTSVSDFTNALLGRDPKALKPSAMAANPNPGGATTVDQILMQAEAVTQAPEVQEQTATQAGAVGASGQRQFAMSGGGAKSQFADQSKEARARRAAVFAYSSMGANGSVNQQIIANLLSGDDMTGATATRIAYENELYKDMLVRSAAAQEKMSQWERDEYLGNRSGNTDMKLNWAISTSEENAYGTGKDRVVPPKEVMLYNFESAYARHSSMMFKLGYTKDMLDNDPAMLQRALESNARAFRLNGYITGGWLGMGGVANDTTSSFDASLYPTLFAGSQFIEKHKNNPTKMAEIEQFILEAGSEEEGVRRLGEGFLDSIGIPQSSFVQEPK